MSPVISVRQQNGGEQTAGKDGQAGDFRKRLLDALAESIEQTGYRATTVGDVVRRAHTSRRTFYAHFADKEACFVALLTQVNEQMIRYVSAAVDRSAPWTKQVRQAVEAWVRFAESRPAIMVSWIRDVPTLGADARRLQRDTIEAFVSVVQTLCLTDEWRAVRSGPVSRELAIMLLGGLCELTASTVEDGGSVGDITDLAVYASTALLGPAPPG